MINRFGAGFGTQTRNQIKKHEYITKQQLKTKLPVGVPGPGQYEGSSSVRSLDFGIRPKWIPY